MSGASSLSSGLETVNDASVAYAALEHERVRRDNALLRFRQARETYEVACIARRRRQLVMQSHNHTLRLLERVVEDVRSVVDAALKKVLLVRESTLAAAELLIGCSCDARADHGLVTLLAHERRRNALSQVGGSPVPPPAPEMPPIPPALSTDSQDGALHAASLEQRMPCPLLLQAAAQLDYGTLLRQQRLPLFSGVARAERLIYLSRSSTREALAPLVTPAASMLQEYRGQVAEARASLRSARVTQQSIESRLYRLHQVLCRRIPIHAERGVFVDAGVAEEIQSQLRRELAVGCVTLLRILCRHGNCAFDERGRLMIA
ncbi:hypothetical protein GH5_04533 [Leishmania sp. Ghana 2012 LV757]|uniref:hypothetical protein n=1 Tax=Leishmania sp. Ghana 2012 LV757 TaxID=2803181 RepID=UPI001B3E22E9|nr:hypothetical protein GH5_04533 [Leishmania sp. Ghana 2012 LV757]